MTSPEAPAAALAERLRGTLLPAAFTPMDTDGRPLPDALAAYAAGLLGGPGHDTVGGVAVWAHTGRGLFLSERERASVMGVWRAATDLPIVAGAGVPHGVPSNTAEQQVAATLAMAEHAAGLGADAIMVYPCAALRALPDRDARVLDLHDRVAETTGLPVVAFLLHGEAGGYPYPPALVRELLLRPWTAGIKTATLFDAVACQDALAAGQDTGALLITGEDRMYGPSFQWGAQAALVGIAAARVELSARVLRSFTDGDSAAFLAASARLDAFAAVTFHAPIEGYIQRMMWAAVEEGLITEDAANDPFGPPPSRQERTAVLDCLRLLDEQP
ncbi:4-hydroxy-tetrahydrodipicolinate synthase [Murinocardiopsis flavida]|uniref:4-hydroxy-tetrahydrodipicolinate synthase n=1 Tax=Murinocardiopsis flavida TaxID=645275 RepID=A0A2P8DIA5_9ACTN|nr:dihydrodipicolinate synthase family protein [Murinocardiopsis flavida]PSK96911.1 4-hydroxy-tetrahydrodipicolinate synthase [Murinocardiopsis flavida]